MILGITVYDGDYSDFPTYCENDRGNAVNCRWERAQGRCIESCADQYRGAGPVGEGAVLGNGRNRCNKEEYSSYPYYCTYLSCRQDCRDLPPVPAPEVSSFCCVLSQYNTRECLGCSGGCSGNGNCLNLDFHCAQGKGCELSCTGTNSCEGLTTYCPGNQVCRINFYGGNSYVRANLTC
jgi:hypothetical protein